jgi:amino acid transporter
MTNVANSRFTIKSWDEKPYSEGQDLPKLTRAAVTRTFTGDIAGEGQVEYLMMYGSDGSAAFVGLERVVGHVAGKAGSFVLQRTGIFENGVAKESYFVIPGSATGELRGALGVMKSARIAFALARAGHLPARWSVVASAGTPRAALTVSSVLAAAFAATGTYSTVVAMNVAMTVALVVVVNIAARTRCIVLGVSRFSQSLEPSTRSFVA